MSNSLQCDVAVLGSGPGGYTAAFRAADLGKKVILIEKEPCLGGVCLNVGCIPSKTLLHASELIEETAAARDYGLTFTPPAIDPDVLRSKKETVVDKLTNGLAILAKARKIMVLRGKGEFSSPSSITVEGKDGQIGVDFADAVIAVGSRPVELPFIPHEDRRIWDSTEALELPFIPGRLAVLGGGIIGLEMARVYTALGSKVTLIEMLDHIIPQADADLVRPLAERLGKHCEAIHTNTEVTAVKAGKKSLMLSLKGKKSSLEIEADALLVSVGRRPNGTDIAAEKAGVEVDEKGFIPVDKSRRSSAPNIYAIGDVTGNPMLAHKAVHEGRIAAEVISGLKRAFDPMTVPSVAYTDPEVAWMGLTENEAKVGGVKYEKGVFPWNASGRSLSVGRSDGFTKLLFENGTGRLIGAGIVGNRAGDLIAEAVLAMEMGADATDMSATIHPHPTFAETLGLAAEMAEGTITDLLPKK